MASLAAPCTYTACFCEENVYLLLQALLQQGRQPSQLFALFISNSNETVPFWYQRASHHQDGLVIWDYHVVALEVCGTRPGSVLVWDLDLQHPQLAFPCSLQQYAQHALQAHTVQLPQQFQRMFRLVPAAALLQHFASDRSHMRRPNGSWSAEPPPYPCIAAADGTANNLQRFRYMAQDILQDSISTAAQHTHPATQQSGPSVAPTAAAVLAGNAVPCRPAAGVVAQEHQAAGADTASTAAVGADSSRTGGCAGTAMHAASGTAAATTNSSAAHANCADRPAECGTGSSGHTGAAVGQDGCRAVGARLVTWPDVLAAAQAGKYGVVLHEHTLLRCLLGNEV